MAIKNGSADRWSKSNDIQFRANDLLFYREQKSINKSGKLCV
jgi:hypothetical protein